MDQRKKRLKIISLLAAVVAVLTCMALILYAYSPLFVSDEPIAEFPQCLKQATSVVVLCGCCDSVVTIQNRFKVRALAKGIVSNLGEPSEFNLRLLDGLESCAFIFYRGDEELGGISALTKPVVRENLNVKVNGEWQWYDWSGHEFLEPYIRDARIKNAARSYDMKQRIERINMGFWPTPP